MENINYANMANNLLGDELYRKLIEEISKENKGENIVDFGKQAIEKCCFLIIALGMSNVIKLDNVKLCFGAEAVSISCKEFAKKYELYAKKIEENLLKENQLQ